MVPRHDRQHGTREPSRRRRSRDGAFSVEPERLWRRRIQGKQDDRLRFALTYGIGVLAIVLISLSFFQGLDRLFSPPKSPRLRSQVPAPEALRAVAARLQAQNLSRTASHAEPSRV